MERIESVLDAFMAWRDRLQRFESSGMPIDVFCKREEVCRTQLVEWLRVLRGTADRSAAEGATFAPVAAYQQTQQLQQQIAASRQEVATLNRVLDETADSYTKLQQEHAAKLEELAWYQRWVHGKRRERVTDGEGQQHLFELTTGDDPEVPNDSQPSQPVTSHSRRRRRELDLSSLPHHRHETDLEPAEKVCDCCGRAKDRIGEDITRVLEHVPAQLEVHEHVRPKYACRYALRCYTSDDRLTIDNNTAERTLRHQAIGRKNWMFLGSENAGPRAAILYTILAGAKRHRIEPWIYLRELLVRRHADDAELEALLPDKWAAANPKHVLTHRLEESRSKAAAKRERRRQRRVLEKTSN